MAIKAVNLFLIAAVTTGVYGICNASPEGLGIRDSAAKVVISSGERTQMTLSGTLEVGYRILPHAVIIHGSSMIKQRYLYLHLSKPIDVIVEHPAWKSVFHQYDIQVVEGENNPTPQDAVSLSSAFNKLVGRHVVVSGKLATPGYNPGSPDWQPFPLTIFVSSITQHVSRLK